MTDKTQSFGAIRRRLLPVFITAFFQGFVFWYAIERLFMKSIGFDDATIGVAIALMAALTLLLEVPSGILADRWSRKGVLLLASASLFICSLICGLSNGVPMYLAGAAFWGIYFAMFSGTHESIVYDTLLEEAGKSDGFKQLYARVRLFYSIALISSSLLSGVIGHFWGLRTAFFLTLGSAALACVAIWHIREPSLHKTEAASKVGAHIKETAHAVLKKQGMFWIVATMIVIGVATRMISEFGQLWYIALLLPLVLYGPATALTQASIGLAAPIAARLENTKAHLLIFGTVLVAGTMALTAKSAVVVIAAQVLALTGYTVATVLLTQALHDKLDSKIRTGAASLISSLSQLAFLPLALLFGVISKHSTVFAAAWLLIGVTALGAVGLFYALHDRKSGTVTADAPHLRNTRSNATAFKTHRARRFHGRSNSIKARRLKSYQYAIHRAKSRGNLEQAAGQG